MSKRNDGGPAFPKLDGLNSNMFSGYDAKVYGGMSLRDAFAIAALPEVMNKRRNAHNHDYAVGTNGFDLCYCGPIAKEAYAFADAMLAERDK